MSTKNKEINAAILCVLLKFEYAVFNIGATRNNPQYAVINHIPPSVNGNIVLMSPPKIVSNPKIIPANDNNPQ